MNTKVLEWIGIAMCFAALAIMLFTEFNAMFLIFAALIIADRISNSFNLLSTNTVFKWWIIWSMGIASLLDIVLAVRMLTH